MFSSNLIKNLRFLKIIIFLSVAVFGKPLFAYISMGESIAVKLLYTQEYIADVSVKNVIADYRYVVMNRGTSDGLFENDHFSFQQNNKFAFRGVVVKADLFRSMWLTYHNYTPSILILNSDFLAKKINTGHIPKRVSNIKKVISSNIESAYENFLNNSNDQPESFNSNDRSGDNERVKIVDKKDVFEFDSNVELEELVAAAKTSVDYFSWNISASPISFSRVPKTADLGYSLKLDCLVCKDFSLSLNYSYTRSTEKPPKSEFSQGDEARILSSSNYNASIDFKINNIFGNIAYWIQLSWSRSRTADVFENKSIYSPEYIWRGTPIGLSYNFISNDKIPELSLNYGIEWDLEKVSFINDVTDENGESKQVLFQQSTQKSRHAFAVQFTWQPFESLNISNALNYKPFHDFANKEFNWRDSGPFTNNLSISYITSLEVNLTYTNSVTWDYITKERDGTPSTNMINSFEVTYSFNF